MGRGDSPLFRPFRGSGEDVPNSEGVTIHYRERTCYRPDAYNHTADVATKGMTTNRNHIEIMVDVLSKLAVLIVKYMYPQGVYVKRHHMIRVKSIN